MARGGATHYSFTGSSHVTFRPKIDPARLLAWTRAIMAAAALSLGLLNLPRTGPFPWAMGMYLIYAVVVAVRRAPWVGLPGLLALLGDTIYFLALAGIAAESLPWLVTVFLLFVLTEALVFRDAVEVAIVSGMAAVFCAVAPQASSLQDLERTVDAAHLRSRIPIDLTADRDRVAAATFALGPSSTFPSTATTSPSMRPSTIVLPRTATAVLCTDPVTVVLPITDTTSEASPSAMEEPNTDTTESARSPAGRCEPRPILTRSCPRRCGRRESVPPSGVLVLVIVIPALRPIRIAVGTVRRVGVFMVIAIRGGRRRCGLRGGGTLGCGSRLLGMPRQRGHQKEGDSATAQSFHDGKSPADEVLRYSVRYATAPSPNSAAYNSAPAAIAPYSHPRGTTRTRAASRLPGHVDERQGPNRPPPPRAGRPRPGARQRGARPQGQCHRKQSGDERGARHGEAQPRRARPARKASAPPGQSGPAANLRDLRRVVRRAVTSRREWLRCVSFASYRRAPLRASRPRRAPQPTPPAPRPAWRKRLARADAPVRHRAATARTLVQAN